LSKILKAETFLPSKFFTPAKMQLRNYLQSKLSEMTDLLTQIVSIESQSADKEGCDRVARLIESQLREMGASTTVHPQEQTGNHVSGVWNKGAGSPISMILHMDTVHPRGSFAPRFKIADGKMWAPGVYDMKASHVIALYAIKTLQSTNQIPNREIRILFNSDEEIGSFTSRDLIEETARGCSLVMVMEPALEGGHLKSSRRGVGIFKIIAHGVASHAGGGHDKGVNAIWELSHHIQTIQGWTDYACGIATTVSEIKAGIARNVIPDFAEMHVDTRVTKLVDAEWMTDQMHALKPVLKGATLEIEGFFDRPPMECNDERLQIFDRLKSIAATIGLNLSHGASGAGSDASFTASIAPTMDGFGAVGDGLHAVHEHILLDSLVERGAFNAAVIGNW
jgi:glutamate carboxypeptidase